MVVHECEHCGYRTSNKSCLVRHLVVHTEERPFLCEHCDNRAKRQDHLMVHERVHGDQPFLCEHCAFRTSAKIDLAVHMRIHTEEKPFECIAIFDAAARAS